MKLKELVRDWPLDSWARGSLAWDNAPGISTLAAVTEPGAAGTFDLAAAQRPICYAHCRRNGLAKSAGR